VASPTKQAGPTCSFCGKRESQVTRLVGGPTARICDGCIAICNTVIEATPSQFGGWDAMSDEQLLSSLKPAATAVEASRRLVKSHVGALRKRGASWQAIGDALGISRQAAWERFSR
jgi:biotin operon repressor